MKKTAFLVTLLIVSTFMGCKQKSRSQTEIPAKNISLYANPVIPGDFADPSVIRVANTYYAIGTSSEWAPHFPIFTSKDLVNWTQTTYAFEKTPKWASSSFWAPELFYYNNTFYLYYVARRKSDGVSYIGVATTKNIENGFKDHGVLIEYGSEAIDPFVMEDNGNLYISWKAYGLDERPIELLAAKLSNDGLKLVGDPFTILKDGNLRGIEGQYMVKKDGFYYLFYSEGACCGSKCDYDVRIARSKTLQGPYEKYTKNPILTANNTWKCPGHGTMVKTTEGKWVYMYHAYSQKSDIYTGRQGLIDEIVWDEKTGWPIPKSNVAPSKQNESPYNSVQNIASGFHDDFNNNELNKSWQWDFRNAVPNVTIDNGKLLLSGQTKETNLAGTALTVRPFYGNYTIEAGISNKNESLKGLTVYGDANQCLGLGVVDNNIIAWQVKNNERKVLSTVSIEGYKMLQLKISMKNNECHFYWKDEGNWKPIKLEGESTINGAFLPQWDRSPRPGLIQYGKSEKPAMFDYFKIAYNP
ncbi:family 43 glycosylhydrolase [Galbibacter sp. PAP.153]|uniref:family 43 glycosylhydrolase n=1 Tax=Galbibacter sp. PAP.153 TaxID=3104623 RepID=UPI00300945CE